MEGKKHSHDHGHDHDHHHDHDHGHHHDPNDFTDYMAAVTEYRKSFASKADVMGQAPDPAVRDMVAYMDEIGCENCFDRFDNKTPLRFRACRNLLQSLLPRPLQNH